MNNMVTWAEIPVTDMDRAMSFYKTVLKTNFKREDMVGFDYAMFEADQEAVSGALVAGKNCKPSSEGTIVYLNGGTDLSDVLVRITKLGNPVVIPKTAIGDGAHGYFAQFIDSEGNRVGLFSLK